MGSHEKCKFENIEYLAAQYHILASKLSAQIEEFEKRLQFLAGKVEVSAEASGLRLSFKRVGSGWGLLVAPTNDRAAAKQLTACKLDTKIAAIGLFPRLIAAMEDQHKTKVNVVRGALEKLEALDLALSSTMKTTPQEIEMHLLDDCYKSVLREAPEGE